MKYGWVAKFLSGVGLIMNYRDIEQWDEDNLIQLPTNETDLYEYKSSKTDLKSLKKKISAAASAFWNSGGGIFIAGVDDNGKTDGGIPKIIGNQSARDWADQVIASVEPLGDYAIKMIKNHRKPSDIQSEHVVLVIAFEKSFVGPHMASDKKYYIRAGAHTGAAGHFLVEAIRARRNLEKPLLIGIIKPHSRKAFTLELEILAANDAPAFDVALDFSPLPLAFQKHAKDRFPIHISVIDKTHPFSMEISLWGSKSERNFWRRSC